MNLAQSSWRNNLLRFPLQRASTRVVTPRRQSSSWVPDELERTLVNINDHIRADVRGFIKRGISQKVIARAMGRTESWLSRWLSRKWKPKRPLAITVTDLERWRDYLREWRTEIDVAYQHAGPSVEDTGLPPVDSPLPKSARRKREAE